MHLVPLEAVKDSLQNAALEISDAALQNILTQACGLSTKAWILQLIGFLKTLFSRMEKYR